MMQAIKPWTLEEQETLPLSYKCEILYSNVENSELNTSNLPSDSYLVFYADEEGQKIDICRASRMVDIFDLYYDRFGGLLDRISYSKGLVSPRVWANSKKKEEEVNKRK